jgi:regulator of sirC expression with transglutaminase-like and TPR domain
MFMVKPADRLVALLNQQPAPLDRVMAAVGAVAPEAPDEDEVVARLDALAQPLTGSGGAGPPTPEQVLAYVYGELGFVGNTTDYYSPNNSLVHWVLAHRRGIPLTLAMVGSELARRVGVSLTIVGLPGHVLLGDGAEPSRWFDPFSGGAELDLEGCRQLFGRFQAIEGFIPAMAAPISPTVAAFRMLGNLKLAYRNQGDLPQMVKVLELSAELPGAPVTERLELAGALAALGRDEQAARQREVLATLDPERAATHRAAAARHRARQN